MDSIIKYNDNKKYEYIIHLSDIHIRKSNYNSRYDEYMNVFNNLIITINKLDKENIDKTIILITGDIFHDKHIADSLGIKLFNYLIMELTKLLPVFIIMGNHDYRQEFNNETDLLSALIDNTNISNLYYLKKTGLYQIGSDMLFGLMAINDILQSGNTSGIVENLPDFPDSSNYNFKYKIALFHGIIIDEENTFFKNKGIGISVNWFKSYDFAILGDIHNQQVNNAIWNNNYYDFNNSTKIVWGYSGSLIQQNFGESINNHGFLYWDFKEKKVIPYHINNDYILCKLDNKNNIWYIINIDPKLSLIDFLNKYNYIKYINIRLSSKYQNDIDNNKSDIISILRNKNITYNLNYIFQNDNLFLENNKMIDLSNKNSNNLESSNDITSYNSPTYWIEYIDSNIEKNDTVFKDSNWKSIINNPVLLLINESFILQKLEDITKSKNKAIESCIQNYNDELNVNVINSTLKLEYMDFSWILCFKENCWINFDNMQKNIVLINAPNGYGKSSLLEIICYALFGDGIPSRKNKSYTSSIICKQKPTGSSSKIQLVFNLNNERYMIKRIFEYQSLSDINKVKKKTVLYRLNVYDNIINLVEEKSGNAAVNNWICKKIGDIDSFLQYSLLSQNSDNDFFSMNSSKQNDLLEKSLSLNSIDMLNEILNQSRLSYNHIYKHLETLYTHLLETTNEIKEDDINSIKEQRDEVKEDLDDSRINIFKLQKEISEIINIIDINEKDINDYKINEYIIDLTDKIDNNINKQDINDLHKEQGQISVKLNKYKDILINLKINSNVILNGDGNDNSSNIFEYPWNCYSGEDSKRYLNENVRNLNIENILQESKEIQKYFINLDNNLLNDKTKLEEINNNLINEINTFKEQVKINNEKLLSNNEELIKIQKLKDDDMLKLKTLFIKQSKLSNIKTTISECNTNITKYEKMNDNIDTKNLLLNKNTELLKLIKNYYHAYNKLINDINDINNLIKDVKKKDYPFNPDCKCCQKQPWKIHLNDLEIKLNEFELKKNNILLSLKNNKIEINNYSIFINKLEDKINKINKWITKYNEYKVNQPYWKEQIETINNNIKLENDINNIEKYNNINNNKLNDLQINIINLNQLNKDLNDSIYNSNNTVEQNKKFTLWNNRRDINLDNIQWYCWYGVKISNEYQILLDNEIELISKINKYKNNSEYIEKLNYWNNLIEVKDKWLKYKDLEDTFESKSNYYNIISNNYSTKYKEFEIYNNEKKEIEKILYHMNVLNEKTIIIEKLKIYFLNFREWLYKEKILPKITNKINNIIETLSKNNRIIKLDAIWIKNSINWKYIDGKNDNLIIEKASGYQRFLLGLAMRITLSNLKVSNLKCSQLFIDEGFTSCDEENLDKMTTFISSLLNLYESVIIVSHLEKIKECANITINIQRNDNESLSYLNYGKFYDIKTHKILL